MFDWTMDGPLTQLGQLDYLSGNLKLGLRYCKLALQVAVPERITQ